MYGLQASPNWLTTAVLAVLLAALTWKLGVRAAITWRRESEQQAAEKLAEDAPGLMQPLLENGELEGDGLPEGQGPAESPGSEPPLLANGHSDTPVAESNHPSMIIRANGAPLLGGCRLGAELTEGITMRIIMQRKHVFWRYGNKHLLLGKTDRKSD